VILLMFGAVMVGFLLIMLIGATAPRATPPDLHTLSGDASPLLDLDAEALGKVVSVLLDKMGLELDRASGGRGGELEIHAINPTPLTGGKILVHCVPAPEDTGKVNGLRVQQFIRAVRSSYVSKGLLFTTGEITPDGRLEAEDAPVELFDRHQLQKMIDEHLGELSPEDLRRLQ
jgi:restriction system protein